MIEVKLSELTKQVAEGLNLEDLSNIYRLSKNQITSLLKEANLKISRKGYRLVKDSSHSIERVEELIPSYTENYTLIKEEFLF